MERLQDRVIVVTGGGSGIGAASARRLAAEGAHVVVVDRDVTAGERVADAVGGEFVAADLADRAAVRDLGDRLGAVHPRLHGLVNNAGIVRPQPLAELDDAAWDLQLQILLAAPAFLTRALVQPLAAAGGAVVNISSEGGFRPRAAHTAYDAAKAGIASLTRSLAAELGDRSIRVNSIAPGWVASEMHFGTGPDAAERRQELLERDNPLAIMDRLALPEEIAAVVAFLLSDDASYLTGTCIHADGGMGLG
jgi:NAD(P)-dependent dehydrogenase (short-subunit alcohol dehydrogenase family)